MKYSAQRELVKKIIVGNTQHPTADEIYAVAKKEMPNISLATVYRNLNQLADLGIIGKISLNDGGDRFDGTPHEHLHLICTKCSSISDMHIPLVDEFDAAVYQENGFKISNRDFCVKGVCSDCLSNLN